MDFFTLELKYKSEEKRCFALVYFCLQKKEISPDLKKALEHLSGKKNVQLVNDILVFLAKYPSENIRIQTQGLENLMMNKSHDVSLRNLATHAYPKRLEQDCDDEIKMVLRAGADKGV